MVSRRGAGDNFENHADNKHAGNSNVKSSSDTRDGHEFIEGVRIRLTPAPVGRRVMAALIDVGIISTCLYILMIPFFIFVIGGAFVDGVFATVKGGLPFITIVLVLIFTIFCIVVFHGYFIHFETKTGMTPGKKMMGLKVVSVDGNRLTRGQAVYRDAVRWYLDAILFIPGLVSMLVTEKRQRIGDILAGTMVVYSKAREEQQNFIYVKQADYHALFAHLQPKIPPQELRDGYLQYAYQAFVLGRFNQVSAEARVWRERARSFLERTDEFGLNDITTMRFFAELCFQAERESMQRKTQNKGEN